MSDKGVDKIISHIKAEAEKEISETLRKAQEEADIITKAAQEKAKRETERVLSNGKRSASLEGQKVIAEARINVRRTRMDSQEEAIVASFNAAQRALEELAEKGKRDNLNYKDIMFNLIISAAEIVAGNRLELVFNKRDSKTFNKETLKEARESIKEKTGREVSLSLTKDTIQCLGGVVVRDLENQVEVDNTLETKLNQLKDNLRVDVAKILFEDEI